MPADLEQILNEAGKLADLVAEHPAVENYRKAQKAVTDDPDASRALADFDRTLETLVRQESQGLPVTDAQRSQLESLQSRIASNIKVKALNMAQVEFIDVLRKVNQKVLSKIGQTPATHGMPSSAAGARLGR